MTQMKLFAKSLMHPPSPKPPISAVFRQFRESGQCHKRDLPAPADRRRDRTSRAARRQQILKTRAAQPFL